MALTFSIYSILVENNLTLLASTASNYFISAASGSTTYFNVDNKGNLSTLGGHLSTATYSSSFSNGVVLDYTANNGRISVGSNANLSFYTGGIGSSIMSVFGTNSIIFYQPLTINGTLTSGTLSVTGKITVTGSLSVSNTITVGTISSGYLGSTTVNSILYQIAGVNKAIDGPAFSAYGSIATTLTNGVATKIILDAEEFDTDNAFNTSTYRFLPTLAGYYQFAGHVSSVTYASNASSQIMALYKNGYEYKRGVRIPGNTNGVGTMITSIIFMDGIADYIEMYALQSSGGNIITEIGSVFGPYLQANFVKPSPSTYISIQYLVIGGGGGGGYNWGGGGGGGCFVEGTSGFISGQIYEIVVGNGGTGSISSTNGQNGGNSTITGLKINTSNTLTITAYGGGGGGYNINSSSATSGSSNGNGSGGGAGYPGSGGTVSGGSGVNFTTIDFATINYFNSGGQSRGISTYGCGGGGGAGGVGTEGQNSQGGGNGGAGKTSSITGSSVYYSAGGGGGGGNGSIQSVGGTGNTGGKGGNTIGGAGTNGAGGYGMGGGGGATNNGNGGNGTAGVVILRVLTSQLGGIIGTYTTSTSGSYTIITFTGAGQYIP